MTIKEPSLVEQVRAYQKNPIEGIGDWVPMPGRENRYMGLDCTTGPIYSYNARRGGKTFAMLSEFEQYLQDNTGPLAGITTTHGGDYGKKEESNMTMKWQIGDRKQGNVIVGDDNGTIVACMYAKEFTRQEWKELNTKVLELFDVIEVDE